MDLSNLQNIMEQPVEAARNLAYNKRQSEILLKEKNKSALVAFANVSENVIRPAFEKIAKQFEKFGGQKPEVHAPLAKDWLAAWDDSTYETIILRYLPQCHFAFYDVREIQGRKNRLNSCRVNFGLSCSDLNSEVRAYFYASNDYGCSTAWVKESFIAIDKISADFVVGLCLQTVEKHVNAVTVEPPPDYSGVRYRY